jgi:hypothetical protein
MSANIVLRKAIDSRVDPTSASIAHHDFVVGSSATVWQSFNPTSSSASTNEFTIQVPGQNSLWSRKVMMRSTIGLQHRVLVNVSIVNNTTSSITLPANTVVYVPYRWGVDFTCGSFPLNSLVQTCNSQINGSTINCQASQVMPVIRRLIQGNSQVRKKLACPAGVTGTALISNARGTSYDEASVFAPAESQSGSPANGNFQAWQFYDANGNALFTNVDASVPSMGSNYAAGTFWNASSTPSTAATLYQYNPSSTGVNGTPYAPIPSYAYSSATMTNGSTIMIPVNIGGAVLPPLQSASGAPVPVTFTATPTVYGTLTTMEPLLFPPFTYDDNEVAFTNVQSANVRLTMLTPNDRMARTLRNIEAAGYRSDIPIALQTSAINTLYAVGSNTNAIAGFSSFVPQIDNLAYWTNAALGNSSTTTSPFNIVMYTNFLSPSLLEPIPETLVYPFLQYYPLVTTNGNLTAQPINLLTANKVNDTSVSSGTLTSNIITLNTCPDMLALYVVLDPTVATSTASATGSATLAASTNNIVAGYGVQLSSASGTIVPGSVVTGAGIAAGTTVTVTNIYSTGASTATGTATAQTNNAGTAITFSSVSGTILPGAVVTGAGISGTIKVVSVSGAIVYCDTTFTSTATSYTFTATGTTTVATFSTAFTSTASSYAFASPAVNRNVTYSYSDLLAAITNVSITWNNNASLLQNYLPSELLEVTASNGLECTQTIGLGIANLPYKASVASSPLGFNTGNTANAYNSLINSQATYNTTPTAMIGSPILLAINKDLPTEAGTAAGVSGVYTLQVTINTRFVDANMLPAANAFQFFVTPIQTQYLQLIRGGTSAVVSAVSAADKMLSAPYVPNRTLQGEMPHKHKLTGGAFGLNWLSGAQNHVGKLWSRAKDVARAVQEHAPGIMAAVNAAPSIANAVRSGDYSGALHSAAAHAGTVADAARAVHSAVGQGYDGMGAIGMGAVGHGAMGYGRHGMKRSRPMNAHAY